MNKRRKDILVTGSHRSGSTWIGRVIAASPGVNYIHEPFNIHVHRNDTIFKYWFEYVPRRPDASQQDAKDYISKYLHINFSDGLKKIFEAGNLNKRYSILKEFSKQKISNRQLIKDPIAVMSAEWMAKEFDLDAVVISRHPAAFAASLKVKNWAFDFNHFLKQDDLMKDYLYPFREDMEAQVKKPGDIIDQAILLWNCIYHVVQVYQEKYSSQWIFVRHEDLSTNPVEEFHKLFKQLGLVWNRKVEKFIFSSTQVVQSSEYHLSAKENIFSWKKRLTPSEISRIKEGTGEIAKYFYSEEEW